MICYIERASHFLRLFSVLDNRDEWLRRASGRGMIRRKADSTAVVLPRLVGGSGVP